MLELRLVEGLRELRRRQEAPRHVVVLGVALDTVAWPLGGELEVAEQVPPPLLRRVLPQF